LKPESVDVAVFGLGYIGCVSAACLASLGLRVIGVDRDPHKVESVLGGQAPFYEPGLQELVRAAVNRDLLVATTSAEEGIRHANVAFICVGTPSERNGNLGLAQLRRVIEEIAQHVPSRKKPVVIAIRSTVFPGTCEEAVLPAFAGQSHVKVVSNPEFLREGAAVKDFMEPSLVVVGGDLYAKLPMKPCLVSLRTAEMIKYACNAFHATKISFANEIGALSQRLGVDGQEVMRTLCADEKLNISTAYLKPGFAFGGSCLPKDLRALVYRAGRMDLSLPLLQSALPSNEQHLRRAIDAVLDLPAQRIGVIGLAFKEDTDDLRESPVVSMLEHLIGKGREVRVFDPHIRLDAIYGSNRNFILDSIPHIGRLLDNSLEETFRWSEHLVVVQKQDGPTAERIKSSGLPVLDLVGGPLGFPVSKHLISQTNA
jgi:GDP-mannose 6-dehydrogenase